VKNAKSQWSVWGHSIGLLAAAACGAAAIFLCGCGGKIPPTRYYTFKLPPPAPTADPKTNLVVEIGPFRAADNLRDDRVLYYEKPTQFSYYEYHRWSPDPATLVADLTRRRLHEMAVFAHVRMSATHEPSDFLLTGHLLNFEEIDYESGGKVRVALDLRLVRNTDHKTVWSDRRELEHAVGEEGVNGVVTALSAATDQLLSEMLPGLAAEAEREFKEGAAKSK
jgi:ABC-type uncharacterized transport system auxiliary subunit